MFPMGKELCMARLFGDTALNDLGPAKLFFFPFKSIMIPFSYFSAKESAFQHFHPVLQTLYQCNGLLGLQHNSGWNKS